MSLNKELTISTCSGLKEPCSERGFSVLKLLIGLAVTGFIVFNGAMVVYAYYTNSKVQSCFDGLVKSSMAHADEAAARMRLKELFSTQYIDINDLPDAYFKNLRLHATGKMLEISSSYGETIWPFGKVQAVDADGTYDPDALAGMDVLRDKTRIDLSFKPYAISTADGQ